MKYVIDIDDTILYSQIDENGQYELIGYNKKIVAKINKLYYSGHTIVLWTGRHWNHLTLTKKQLMKIGVRYTTLVMAKPTADFYVDDKALRPDEFE